MGNIFNKKLYGINLPIFENQINKEYLKKDSIGCNEVTNGIILPLRKTELPATDGIYEGGVCDQEFNFISGYKRILNGKSNNFEVVRSYKPNCEIEYVDDEVIFAGVAFHHFGHFIVETFNRLWWVIRNKSKLKGVKIIFLKNRDFNSSFLNLLNFLNLEDNEIVFLDKPTRFKKVYIPDQSLCYLNHYHKEYSIPYETIINNIKPSSHKKIYLSRTKFRKKDCVNEEYFEAFYKDNGFEIVYPEQLSIEEQISLISGADEIVSTMGTISHLALFAKKGAKVITLLRARNYFNIPQAIINQAKQVNYTFIDVTCNFLPHRYSSNCYYIGPTASWVEFVKEYYKLDLAITLADYLDSNNSRMGEYFKLWIKTFSQDRQLNKIHNDNSVKILDTLEIAFSDSTESFSTIASQYIPPVSTGNDSKLTNLVKGKLFKFSRYDNSYMKVISLNDNGTIQTVNGKSHKNESFWTVIDNELVFLDDTKNITARYFHLKETENGFEALGYYERNRSIIFKLQEVIV